MHYEYFIYFKIEKLTEENPMKKSRIFIIISLILLCAGNLYAKDNESDDSGLLIPILTPYGGNYEYISLDAGFEYIFGGQSFESYAVGLYAQAGIGTDFSKISFRVSGGLPIEFLGLIGFQIGYGVEYTPGHETLQFVEIGTRILFINFKCMMEYSFGDDISDSLEPKVYIGIPLGMILKALKS